MERARVLNRTSSLVKSFTNNKKAIKFHCHLTLNQNSNLDTEKGTFQKKKDQNPEEIDFECL